MAIAEVTNLKVIVAIIDFPLRDFTKNTETDEKFHEKKHRRVGEVRRKVGHVQLVIEPKSAQILWMSSRLMIRGRLYIWMVLETLRIPDLTMSRRRRGENISLPVCTCAAVAMCGLR
jgi:hypothetical protein